LIKYLLSKIGDRKIYRDPIYQTQQKTNDNKNKTESQKRKVENRKSKKTKTEKDENGKKEKGKNGNGKMKIVQTNLSRSNFITIPFFKKILFYDKLS
jgi:hypothetical protein